MSVLARIGPLVTLLAGVLYGAGGEAKNYVRNPLLFEKVQAGGLPFHAHLSGRTIGFGASGTVFDELGGRPKARLEFLGAHQMVEAQVEGSPTGYANYFLGSRPEDWHTGVPLFGKIKYTGLYPGVDLIYYGIGNRLEYDLVVAPGASWRAIRLAARDAEGMQIDGKGDLHWRVRSAWITQSRPIIYQAIGSRRREVSGHFVRTGRNSVGFAIGAYDRSRPLIIDPALAYSSYLGGSGNDYGHAIAVDSAGSAYVVGETASTNFPQLGAEQSSLAGNSDLFVTKWNAAGTGLVYSTYIGGSNRDVAMGVAVDSAGNAYVTGFTYSGDFPITAGALRSSFVGESKAFVLKLNAAGNALIYSTYLGGSGADYGTGIAVDAAGEAHVAGYTASIDFPTTINAFQHTYGGGSYDGFLAKLNAGGTAVEYATYLGGIGDDTAAGVALDASGDIYVTGQTQSWNFPTLNPFEATASETDAFVVKISATGQALYSTFLGGTGITSGTAIAADASGNAYVTGFTNSPDFPVTSGAYQNIIGGSYDAFVATLNPSGSGILDATFVGGAGSDSGYGIALDGSGNVFIAGSTASINFPVKSAVQSSYNGGGDAFIAAFNNQLTALLYATYFGGSGGDTASAIASDAAGDAYVTGWTSSGESSVGLPVTAGAFEPIGPGEIDAFAAKLVLNTTSIACTTSTPQALTVLAGSPSQLVGDFILNCTGGTSGTYGIVNLQIALNAGISGNQPELFVGSNTIPIYGAVGGNGTVLFQGVQFAAPGSSASVSLRITNVWANLSTLAAGTAVVMTASFTYASPAMTLAPAQQTVALAQNVAPIQLQQLVLSKAAVGSGCTAPPAASGFLVSDPAAVAWIQLGNAVAGGVARLDWWAPSGVLYQSHSFTASAGGTQCFWDSLNITGTLTTPMAGAWQLNLWWNNALLSSAPFVVSTVGVKRLIFQNNTTGQINANFYGGAGNTTLVGVATLNTGKPGWTLVAAADFNGDGVPDLVWQNQTSGQVNVDYYGGPGGVTLTGSACLTCSYSVYGWQLRAVADMDGNGVPDLIFQNDSTYQVNVNYYGGSGGTTCLGWANLTAAYNPAGWTLITAADFNGNGVPDLVFQNNASLEINVNYYAGTGGATCVGWADLTTAYVPVGWRLVAATDFNGNGVPDLLFQYNASGQVDVNYYGGPGGSIYLGWANLTATYSAAGWSLVAAY